MADDGGGSRLDRLLRLLETGSSPAARHEAARQIGELASAHPNQLPNLLRRVRPQPDPICPSFFRCRPTFPTAIWTTTHRSTACSHCVTVILELYRNLRRIRQP